LKGLSPMGDSPFKIRRHTAPPQTQGETIPSC
jgi:hypothetical protein